MGGRAAARAARATGQGTFFSKIQATGERLATTTTGEAPSARASVQAGHAPHESHFLQHTTGASRRRDYITDHAPRSTCLQGHTHCNFIFDRQYTFADTPDTRLRVCHPRPGAVGGTLMRVLPVRGGRSGGPPSICRLHRIGRWKSPLGNIRVAVWALGSGSQYRYSLLKSYGGSE